MTEREKIAHLLRRFGFGAGQAEVDRYMPLGVNGALDRLINYEKVDEQFTIPPWQFVFNKGTKDNNLDPRIFTNWWCTRMVMSQRPLQQKLALFYSNLLVVGADKVDYGAMTIDYLQTLLDHAASDFHVILSEVSKSPAMIKYLDNDHNLRGKPNENFGREVMELFTLGIGNYSEQDVKEAARAFTGWWYRYLVFEDDGHNYNDRVIEYVKMGLPMVAYCWIPDIHDTTPKTVLGKTKPYTGEELMEELAARPETAKRIGTRLWEYFAYANPPEKVKGKMAASFKKHKGNARLVLQDMAHMDEFWSKECVRQLVKSPADFVVPIIRQLDLGDAYHRAAGPPDPVQYIPPTVRHVGDVVSYNMDIMGLLPLHPPNVKGFDWGDAFINSNSMIKRMEFSGVLYDTLCDHHLGDKLRTTILAAKPKDETDAIRALLNVFDAELPESKVALLAGELKKAGGVKPLQAKNSGTYPLVRVCKVLFGAPEFQLC
ncbi:MAG TPA: DUF1800 domain-containing protein [Fimbriimonadaceae bacterium]|nr:DUF1800 domain-containing protein [Fimbriimonadaceae bacterium]